MSENNVCGSCGGSWQGTHTCPHQHEPTAPKLAAGSKPTVCCPTCNGTGRVKAPCPLCNNTGLIIKSVSQRFSDGYGSGGQWAEACPRGCPAPVIRNAAAVGGT